MEPLRTDSTRAGSMSDCYIARTPADIPAGARVIPVSQPIPNRLLDILRLVRPDLTICSEMIAADDGTLLLATGPSWSADLANAQPEGGGRKGIIMPEVEGSYHEYLAIPLDLISRNERGDLSADKARLTEFVRGYGSFFGSDQEGEFVHETSRYQPLFRTSLPDAPQRAQTIAAKLSDEASRLDYMAALTAAPEEMWAHWLKGLYSGLQYTDYIDIQPGQTVLNCGVHGGNEIPHFIAPMGGDGRIVNIDPLGHDFLLPYCREALRHFRGEAIEVRAALHDSSGQISLPVEPGGMAAGNRIGEELPGLESRTFRAATIDEIVNEFGLTRIDLLKTDVEGAEPRALSGGMASIKRLRPALAISIYHSPEQIIELPELLMGELCDYTYFVRSYHWISNEVIMYCIPRERTWRPRAKPIGVRLV
jgi:FkbM family methyltransferase